MAVRVDLLALLVGLVAMQWQILVAAVAAEVGVSQEAEVRWVAPEVRGVAGTLLFKEPKIWGSMR